MWGLVMQTFDFKISEYLSVGNQGEECNHCKTGTMGTKEE